MISESASRFQFGKNWSRFLSCLTTAQVEGAKDSLAALVGQLDGKSFLDIGCGSGLHSLAALQLGARRVVSFDYDGLCVQCCRQLKQHYAPDSDWAIAQGSALDTQYLRSLGTFEVVYSWGVLHHTGDLWTALNNAGLSVAVNGVLAISIYNDQGPLSTFWLATKRTYNRLPKILRPLCGLAVLGPRELARLMVKGPKSYVRAWLDYYQLRGMSYWHDLVDWIGGYPFQVAKPEDVFRFFHERGFQLEKLKTCRGRAGCNEFVFSRFGGDELRIRENLKRTDVGQVVAVS